MVRCHADPLGPSLIYSLVQYNAILGYGLGWTLFHFALRHMPASMAGLGTLASPLVGVLAACLQLGESPAPMDATGMSLIGTALAMLAWSPKESDPA